MKNFTLSAFVLSTLCLAGASQAAFVTQMIDNTTITAGNSASCNSNNLHTDNWYARGFDLAAMGYGSPFQVTSVRIGIESASAASGSQGVTVNLYDGFTTAGALLNPGTLIGSATATITNQTLSFVTINVSALVTSGKVVAELFTPNGQPLGNSFFIGSNSLGQTGPSYIKAPACGVNSLTDLGAIGLTGMHQHIALNGQPVPEPATMAALGVGVLALIRRRKTK